MSQATSFTDKFHGLSAELRICVYDHYTAWAYGHSSNLRYLLPQALPISRISTRVRNEYAHYIYDTRGFSLHIDRYAKSQKARDTSVPWHTLKATTRRVVFKMSGEKMASLPRLRISFAPGNIGLDAQWIIHLATGKVEIDLEPPTDFSESQLHSMGSRKIFYLTAKFVAIAQEIMQRDGKLRGKDIEKILQTCPGIAHTDPMRSGLEVGWTESVSKDVFAQLLRYTAANAEWEEMVEIDQERKEQEVFETR